VGIQVRPVKLRSPADLSVVVRRSLPRDVLTALLGFFALLTPIQSLGVAETYTGLLIPDAQTAAIPVTVELEQSRSTLSGHVKTSPPLTGTGRIVSGERLRSICNFKSDIGAGRTLEFEGYCLSTTIEGAYKLVLPDGSSRPGTYRLLRAASAANVAKKAADPPPDPLIRSTASCLTANSACLAACPRDDYNAAFICSNRCRQKAAACKAKAATTGQSSAAPGTQRDSE
jgi:hypothetical protein